MSNLRWAPRKKYSSFSVSISSSSWAHATTQTPLSTKIKSWSPNSASPTPSFLSLIFFQCLTMTKCTKGVGEKLIQTLSKRLFWTKMKGNSECTLTDKLFIVFLLRRAMFNTLSCRFSTDNISIKERFITVSTLITVISELIKNQTKKLLFSWTVAKSMKATL